MDYEKYKNNLATKIMILDEILWEGRAKKESIERWLKNFKNERERIHALFLISQFTYFGSKDVRNLLISLYRDVYKYKKIEKIRKELKDITDLKIISEKYNEKLDNTRFLGVGNPSESGTHMLYYFRQENKLSKTLFMNVHELFENNNFKYPNIEHYVFIDDFCGSGSQVKKYLEQTVTQMRQINKNILIDYYMLVATNEGYSEALKLNFSNVEAVFLLDNSFKVFEKDSRYFKNLNPIIKKTYLKKLCHSYGKNLMYYFWKREKVPVSLLDIKAEKTALGFGDCQLLLGFHHNVPDNSLPIIWYDEGDISWVPMFKRYNKKYSL